MNALRDCVSVHQIREMLDKFPTQIEEVYIRTWHRILEQSQESVALAKQALIWVLYASRSMTIDELVQATATSPETHCLDPMRVVPATTILALCRGLLVMEEESKLVRLLRKLRSCS